MSKRNVEPTVSEPASEPATPLGGVTPLPFVDTIAGVPPRPTSAVRKDACLVQIYPLGAGIGSRLALRDSPMSIGRDSECALILNDPSVSRRHAEFRPAIDGHYLIDLKSTNGTFINDNRATASKLKDGDTIRIGNWIFRYLTGDNVETLYHEEIYRLAIVDALTGIPNKRYFLEFLDRELSRSAHHGRALSLVMIDIDHFKAINDQLGHLAGDHTLRELAQCVKAAIRKDELFARYGGEEFAVVLPETSAEAAAQQAEAMRQRVEQCPLSFEGKPYTVTISLGVTTIAGSESLAPEELIRRADEKLYQAKQAGRNRVAV